MASTNFWYLENIIDYAGTFPPAAFSPSEAFQNYVSYLGGEEAWILGSLAWSCGALGDLAPLAANSQDVELAIIGRPSNSWETWLEARAQDNADIQRVVKGSQSLVAATYESKLGELDHIGDALGALKPLSRETDVFIELPWDRPLEDVLAEIAGSDWARVKFRTGGVAKDAYPTPLQLASVIKQCVDLEIEFKLTAGLHEPIAHIDSSNGAFAHGFLNVLMATAMAFSDDASAEEMASVLESSDPADWRVGDGLAYKDKILGEDELNDARSFFGSFGSCSIDEPLDGLGRLQGL